MKLTVQTFLTLDGVMQAPRGPEEDPSDAFNHGGWQAPFADPAVGEFVTELNSHASAFLFGRRTFEIFRGYWPDQTGPANPICHGDQLAAQVRRLQLAQRGRCHLARRAP
jgi:dihydrofolate reductase